MTTTNFVSGTVIQSDWLNDVDEAVYTTLPSVQNASGVTYTPAGTGAVPTTVQAKLRESVSVLDFGAVGDGVTDDTAAIQAALDSLTDGGTLYFPLGVYLTDAVSISFRGVIIQGDTVGVSTLTSGVQIKCRSAATNFFFVDEHDIQVNNVYINGNGLATNTVRFNNDVTDVIFRKVTVDGCATNGVNVNLTPLAVSVLIDFITFESCFFNGSAGRTDVTNVLVWDIQSLNIAFYNCWWWTGSDDYSVTHHLWIKSGGVVLYNPYFQGLSKTAVPAALDIRFYLGDLRIYRGRSESQSDSIWAENQGQIAIYDYVHAAVTGTFTTFKRDSADITLLCGGLYSDIELNAPSYTTLINLAIQGAITGVRASEYTKIDSSVTFVPKLALTDGVDEPATISGQAFLFVEVASGDLKIKFGDGTVKTIITD